MLKSIEHNDINPEFDNFNLKSIDGIIINSNDISKNQDKNSNINYNKNNMTETNFKNFTENKKEENEAALNLSNSSRHNFEICVEKLINLQVLNKLIKFRPYLKYKFFDDSSFVKSDVLFYSEYEKETSIILVDMKTSHSNVIKNSEKIKDLLKDLEILLCYENKQNEANDENEEICVGKANLPVEDLQELVFNSTTNTFNSNKSTLFVYGNERINREDCIIGKMKISMRYKKEEISCNENENILYENQVTYSRKIPKNCCFVINFNYFKYNDSFLRHYDCIKNDKNNFFYFEIDPFFDDKNLKAVK